MKHVFRTRAREVVVAGLLAAAGAGAWAHDSWFAPLGTLGGDEPLLALGTGNQFPVMEFAIGPEFLVREGCRWPDGTVRPTSPVRVAGKALILRPGKPGATGCWAQLQPFDVEVPHDKVDLYLEEINATPALRSTWAARQARGVPWKERYTKHARIELQAPAVDAVQTDMAVDIRRVSGPAAGSTHAGDVLEFEVRRGGQPLAGLRMELRHATEPQGAFGTWHETDAQGRVQVRLPTAGQWLLRGVDLRSSTTRPDEWESDFLTLAFSVLAK